MTTAQSIPPLRCEPLLKTRAWGGRRLSEVGKSLPSEGLYGESWDLADLPDSISEGRSHIAEGPFQGRTLHDLLNTHQAAIMGQVPLAATHGFPLLVKFLDAREDLSLQVHPTAAYAHEHPNSFLKSEMWYVLKADPGAKVYRGVRDDVTPEQFSEAIRNGTTLDCMVIHEVEAGDCVRLPSGICHALGAGILVAEFQTPSDTTFRVWDWNRNDPGRPLHIEQAMDAMRFGAQQHDGGAAVVRGSAIDPVITEGTEARRVCTMDEFTVDCIDREPGTFAISHGNTPEVLMCIEGEGHVSSSAGQARFRTGDVVLVPATSNDARVESSGPLQFLHAHLPAVPGKLLA